MIDCKFQIDPSGWKRHVHPVAQPMDFGGYLEYERLCQRQRVMAVATGGASIESGYIVQLTSALLHFPRAHEVAVRGC